MFNTWWQLGLSKPLWRGCNIIFIFNICSVVLVLPGMTDISMHTCYIHTTSPNIHICVRMTTLAWKFYVKTFLWYILAYEAISKNVHTPAHKHFIYVYNIQAYLHDCLMFEVITLPYKKLLILLLTVTVSAKKRHLRLIMLTIALHNITLKIK